MKILNNIDLNFLIEKMPGYVYWVDQNNIYQGCNELQARVFGLSASKDIVGLSNHDILTLNKTLTEVYERNNLQVIQNKQDMSFEEPGILSDGSECILFSQKKILIGPNEEFFGVINLSVDITQLKTRESDKSAEKAAEMQQKAVDSYLEYIVEYMPGSFYWKNKEGIYLGCNNLLVQMLNLKSKNDIIGKTDYDLWPEQAETLRANDKEVMKSGQSIHREETVILPNDEQRYYTVVKIPFKDLKGNIIGIIGNSLDITTLKQITEELRLAKESAEAANKAKTEFLENMRHDIRTPLSGIVGLAELLNSENIDRDKIREFTANLEQASKELLRFLNEVLESINVASGEIPLLKKRFNLREVLENVVKLHQPVAVEKGLTLALFIGEDIPTYLIGDPVRIYRILLELIVNALKFTKKGHVNVFASLGKKAKRNVTIKIFVEDTGVGISAEKQQDLFVRFKRLTPSYEGIYKGAGLGLSIVKQFLEDIEGEIYVDSRLDKGTKFVCIFPLKEPLLDEDPFKDILTVENLKAITPGTQPLKQNKQTLKRYGLIVEDQPIAALVEKTLLVEQGCEVDIVESGIAAIQKIQEKQYDFILMDIGLPDINGYEVTKRIRLLEVNSKQKAFIIGLTGHADPKEKQSGLDAGMNMVLTKPLTQSVFVELLENFIPHRLTDS